MSRAAGADRKDRGAASRVGMASSGSRRSRRLGTAPSITRRAGGIDERERQSSIERERLSRGAVSRG